MQKLNYKIKDIFILKNSKKCSEDQKDSYENKLDRWLDQYDQIIIKLGIQGPVKRKSKKNVVQEIPSIEERLVKS